MNNKRNFYIETKEVCHWCNQDNCELRLSKNDKPFEYDYIVSMCQPNRWTKIPKWMYLELKTRIPEDVQRHVDDFWNNKKSDIPAGWEVMPEKYRNQIIAIYKNDSFLKKGKTFKVGNIIINNIPDLKIIKGFSYELATWRYIKNKYWYKN